MTKSGRDRLKEDEVVPLTAASDPVLAELWDNEEDSVYDNLPDETESDDA